jgi:hypothetical protein
LIVSLRDENRDVRVWAAISLTRITGKDFGESPQKWEEWWKNEKSGFIKKK